MSTKSLSFPDTCTRCIDRLHAALHASYSELSILRTENAELKQLLESKKKALSIFQRELNAARSDGSTDPAAPSFHELELKHENERLSSELALARGRLDSLKLAWEDCFKRLKGENEQMRKTISELELALRESKTDILKKSEAHASDPRQINALSKLPNGGKGGAELPFRRPASESLKCKCSHSHQVDHLKRRIEELKANEKSQRDRADDLSISLEAYKIALEKQYNESRKFIKNLSKLLENPSTAEESKSTETLDSAVCNELTHWIGQALKSAVHASGNRIQIRNGGSIPSSEVSSSPSSPSSTPPHSPSKEVSSVDKQYRRHPVNSRSKGRKTTLRLQTLSRALEFLHGTSMSAAKKASPLETLLLMVNEVLEKLTEGKMEEYIHSGRFKQKDVSMRQVRGGVFKLHCLEQCFCPPVDSAACTS
ncbi:hypothetical protein TcWFU_007532 [Taenia crassiceps]|uniref:Uncharacterized protein n=1 Tax=Taenia crassiceps TaxID=6207 RepID=A0ABR4QHX9_9CEST